MLILSHQLVLNPHSRVFAIRGGSPDLQGWDAATVTAVRTHNLIAALLTGLSGGKHDESIFIDYPGRKPEEDEIHFATIADFSEAMFNKFMS
ncbi:hypothetical protein [Microbacterium lacus]|uniref:hypothetical protein n=1 Tax=Microbacterium lacus TaxID=415217 RepID=UPI000C2B8D3B|nr:hypothetical protein [Microbacterium lacus]